MDLQPPSASTSAPLPQTCPSCESLLSDGQSICSVCLATGRSINSSSKGTNCPTPINVAPPKSVSNDDYTLAELVSSLGFPPGTRRQDIPAYAHHYLNARKTPAQVGSMDEILSRRLDELTIDKSEKSGKPGAPASEKSEPKLVEKVGYLSEGEPTVMTKPVTALEDVEKPDLEATKRVSTGSITSPAAGLPVPSGAGNLGIDLKPLPTVEKSCVYHTGGGCDCSATAQRRVDAVDRKNVAETLERGLMMNDTAKRRLNSLCNSTVSDFLYWPNGPGGVLPPKLSYFPETAFVIRGLNEKQLEWIMHNYGITPETNLQRSQQKLLLFLGADYLANLM